MKDFDFVKNKISSLSPSNVDEATFGELCKSVKPVALVRYFSHTDERNSNPINTRPLHLAIVKYDKNVLDCVYNENRDYFKVLIYLKKDLIDYKTNTNIN